MFGTDIVARQYVWYWPYCWEMFLILTLTTLICLSRIRPAHTAVFCLEFQCFVVYCVIPSALDSVISVGEKFVNDELEMFWRQCWWPHLVSVQAFAWRDWGTQLNSRAQVASWLRTEWSVSHTQVYIIAATQPAWSVWTAFLWSKVLEGVEVSFIHSRPQYCLEGSYLHSHPACLAPREGTLEPTECGAVWAPEPFWELRGMVNSLALLGTEPQFLGVNLVSTSEVFSVPKYSTSDPDRCESDVSFYSKYWRCSLFHRAFFNSIMDKTPTHALFYSTLY